MMDRRVVLSTTAVRAPRSSSGPGGPKAPAIDAGGNALNSRGQLTYLDALGLVLDGLKYNPLDDPEDWKTRSRDCYMGVKHADRPMPDSLVLANTYRENLLIFRLWIASRLGVSATNLAARMSQDPHAADYVHVD